MLKKTISNSKKLSQVSDRAKVIWFMMLPHCDVEGRLNACPVIVKGQYLTMFNYNIPSIQKCLEELHSVDLIKLYIIDGNQYAEFTRFHDFQSLRPDREAASCIPPASSGTTPGVIQEDSRYKLSKDKLSKDNNNSVKIVLDHWNSKKLQGRWKIHRNITPDIRYAILNTLKEWTIEDIKGAIDNFSLILQGVDYMWTYDRWGLVEFLTRKLKDDRKINQWIRFHPNNFRDTDWLTEKAKLSRINKRRNEIAREQRREKYIEENRAWIIEASADNLIKRCQIDPHLRSVVNELRPDITI